jgi:hypothetical protein
VDTGLKEITTMGREILINGFDPSNLANQNAPAMGGNVQTEGDPEFSTMQFGFPY